MPETILEWAKALAVFGGVCVGVFAVYSPAFVWLRKQMFGWGGAILCCFGTILIVASLFRNVTLVVDAPKLEFKLAELEKQLSQVGASVTQTVGDVAKLQASLSPERTAEIQNLQRSVAELSGHVTQLNRTTSGLLAKYHWSDQNDPYSPRTANDYRLTPEQKQPFSGWLRMYKKDGSPLTFEWRDWGKERGEEKPSEKLSEEKPKEPIPGLGNR